MYSKQFKLWVILVMALFSISAICACGSDETDDINGSGDSGQSSNVSLFGRTFEKTDDSGLEKATTRMEFASSQNCIVRVSGYGYDENGRYTFDWGEVLCPYSISGNTVTINLIRNDGYYKTYVIKIVNGGLEGYHEKASSVKNLPDASQQGIKPGYYFCKELTEAHMTMEAMEAAQDRTIGSASLEGSTAVIRIIDNVLMQIYWVVATHTNKGGSMASEKFTVGGSSYPVYYYLSDAAGKVFYYTIKGNDVYVDNNKKYTYSNGALSTDYGYNYIKVK